MTLIDLFIRFFQVGLFTIGGGLVAIPIMQEYILSGKLISDKMFIDMIAVSQSTPGPIGVNMATYIGFIYHSLLGSVVATIGMVLPSLIIISLISRFLEAFKQNIYVKSVFSWIRPVAIGVIGAAAYTIFRLTLIDGNLIGPMAFYEALNLKAVVLFIGVFLLRFKIKWHPILYIAIGGLLGVLIF